MTAIGDIKTRLQAKFSRRNSAAYPVDSSSAGPTTLTAVTDHDSANTANAESGDAPSFQSKLTARSCQTPSHRGSQSRAPVSPFSEVPPMMSEAEKEGCKANGGTVDDDAKTKLSAYGDAKSGLESGARAGATSGAGIMSGSPREELELKVAVRDAEWGGPSFQLGNDKPPTPCTPSKLMDVHLHQADAKHDSTPTANLLPTPEPDIGPLSEDFGGRAQPTPRNPTVDQPLHQIPTTPTSPTSPLKPDFSRRQSLFPAQQTRLIKTLLETDLPPRDRAATLDYFSSQPSTIYANMVTRKIWVKRPGASATLVSIHEDDLVDDVREMILKKYANSLGRNFDAPDVTLRIVPRDQKQERTLGPEEPMTRTLDAYFPGGQTVDEALIIDVPLRRTPRPSPRPSVLYYDDGRPLEAGSEYFPPMPVPVVPSPHLPHSVPTVVNGHPPVVSQHAMSVLTTGHVPALPSPGSARRHHRERPRMGRTHASSPSIIGGHAPPTVVSNGTQVYNRHSRSRTHSSASEKSAAGPPAPPPLIPTPPIQDMNPAPQVVQVATPPARVSSPRPPKDRSKKKKVPPVDPPALPVGLLNGGVPPINVLIVEDNIINLKLLEAFMKRLKVRWQTAMNGKEAVTKWRLGGFHLVLMDIQLPIMSGLGATKEIRRLERLNSIGVFSSSASSTAPEKEQGEEPQGDDVLPATTLFKSPVIIVALTASSLQSDRHEALAAGCNDFLTKPVNFVWLERKVMEWGCMQALIDFDGWRKWKDFSQTADSPKESKSKDKSAAKDKLAPSGDAEKKKRKKNRSSLGSAGAATATATSIKEENEEPSPAT